MPLETDVKFASDGLTLAGTVSVPEGLATGEKRPAFLVLHGFGSTRQAGNVKTPAGMLNRLGYVTLRFDMRGCGDSAGAAAVCLSESGRLFQSSSNN